MDTNWDCIVVGGGAAGLSAALTLGRARRRTLLVDAGEQSNLPAHGIGGLLGHDGRPPAELYALGRRELAAYPSVEVRDGEVVRGEALGDGFALTTAAGEREVARRVVLAGGMDYRPPGLPGVAERWGTAVFHCPFCHGWELRDGPLAVLGAGGSGAHRALLLRYWSDDVMLLTDGPDGLDEADRGRLRAAGVTVDDRPVTALEGRDGALETVVFADGARLARTGLLVPAPLHQRSALAAQLGVAASDPNPITVDPVAIDARFTTNVPGIFAVGDLGGQLPQVAVAGAAGSQVGAFVVQSLMVEDHDMAPVG